MVDQGGWGADQRGSTASSFSKKGSQVFGAAAKGIWGECLLRKARVALGDAESPAEATAARVSVGCFHSGEQGHPQKAVGCVFWGGGVRGQDDRWLEAVSGREGDLCQTEKKVKLGVGEDKEWTVGPPLNTSMFKKPKEHWRNNI